MFKLPRNSLTRSRIAAMPTPAMSLPGGIPRPWSEISRAKAASCRTSRICAVELCDWRWILETRTNVHFHRSTPIKVVGALEAKGVLILNPTHTRMGNDGTIKAKRKFLSEEGRVYVSASNWDVC